MQPYIYAIKGNGMTYYGSSIQPLYERKSTHVTSHKYYKTHNFSKVCCKSILILDSCNDWTIEKIEELPIETTKEELLLRENYYIENFDCVNKNLAIRTEEIQREYQRQWAENNRREKGIPIKEKIKTLDEKSYKREKARQYREAMTEEEKQKHLEHRRELYAEKEQTDEQKEAAKKRAKKQREEIKADPEKLAQQREYKRLKAREYYAKKKAELTKSI
jgi:hypothetical protein